MSEPDYKRQKDWAAVERRFVVGIFGEDFVSRIEKPQEEERRENGHSGNRLHGRHGQCDMDDAD